jgi:WXG100 family type VII secretion target
MTAPWSITPAALSQARADSVATAESISAQLDQLTHYVDDLLAEWLGVASAQFGGLMIEYNVHAQNIQKTLNTIATTLGANHDAAVDTESENTRLVTPAGGAELNPARFR